MAGQVTGSMTAGQTVNDPTGANSFVAVYDSQGDQVWTQQDDGLTPNQANAVAFGANGDVYVTGQTQTTTGLQPSGSPSNSFLQVFSTTGQSIAKTQIASGGPNTSSGVAVDGTNVYVAGVQNGDAVVSEYDVSNPAAPSLVASRDLGALNGGTIAGVSVQNGTVYVAGTAAGGALNAGTVTSAASGSGLNAFAATLSTGLAPSGSDALAYYGGIRLDGGLRHDGGGRPGLADRLGHRLAAGRGGDRRERRLRRRAERRRRHGRLRAALHRPGRAGGPDLDRRRRGPARACSTSSACRKAWSTGRSPT